MDNQYPLSIKPSAQLWAGCVKVINNEARILGVFGWRKHEQTVEITDFYIHQSRWGYIAAYAMMEKIKMEADKGQYPLVTATPFKNEHMIAAYKKHFGVSEPTLMVYRYVPVAAEVDAGMIYKVGEGI
jgi:hypothetical protein